MLYLNNSLKIRLCLLLQVNHMRLQELQRTLFNQVPILQHILVQRIQGIHQAGRVST